MTWCHSIEGHTALLRFVGPGPDWQVGEVHHSSFTGWVKVDNVGHDKKHVHVTGVWMRPCPNPARHSHEMEGAIT